MVLDVLLMKGATGKVLFETKDKAVTLSVPVEQETVWLTQAQMTELFNTSKQNVSLHINNCFKVSRSQIARGVSSEMVVRLFVL